MLFCTYATFDATASIRRTVYARQKQQSNTHTHTPPAAAADDALPAWQRHMYVNKIYANMQTQHAQKTKRDTHTRTHTRPMRKQQSSLRQCKPLDVLDKRVASCRLVAPRHDSTRLHSARHGTARLVAALLIAAVRYPLCRQVQKFAANSKQQEGWAGGEAQARAGVTRRACNRAA